MTTQKNKQQRSRHSMRIHARATLPKEAEHISSAIDMLLAELVRQARAAKEKVHEEQ